MIHATLSQITPILEAQHIGQNVSFTGCGIDTRQDLTGQLFVALRGERFDAHEFTDKAQQQGAVALVVSQPVSTDLPQLVVEDTKLALGQIAYFWRQQFDIPTIAVTGSNGKTTTKEMLKAIFAQQGQVLATQGNFNNDIGLPLTLFNLAEHHDSAILEMGANHVGEIGYLTKIAQPNVATITQCAPAHLAGFKTIENIAEAKGEIFSGLNQDGVAVINQDDRFAPYWRELAQPHPVIEFGLSPQADVSAQNIQLSTLDSSFELTTFKGHIPIHLPLAGQHNIMNALAAAACALASDIDLETIQQGLASIQPVAGRLQTFKGLNHSILINDTYNANPTSFKAALSVLQQYPTPRWLIMGDMGELGLDSAALHQEIGEIAYKTGVEQLWALGDYSRYAVESFQGQAQHFTTHEALLEALNIALMQQSHATLLIKGSRSMTMEKITFGLQVEDNHAALVK
ncbi:UDP-N-acetylmuramoyl-tripeptide--D-alanyl-D-alanine ligase [Candidatus Albibeggiatoa sp. nov. NOAA]|uniref:UDP-N-acetylmuramoyl-tripeptide--D-alanyl-D- alanine ligase n=1 Tax=Candidatus Albibeggiatoa sp. nov. NOAA TaxID=3162724 RepID=UPI0032F0F007|nr:UDP-N-acetylmuramoyl-tripeptide--D-alanyl-D-alanine ligase [Thiotrichaceae bacterium]